LVNFVLAAEPMVIITIVTTCLCVFRF